MRTTILALTLLLPVAAVAQPRQSGPDAPATSAQPTPQRLPGDRAGPPADANAPRDVTANRNDDPGRTTPPPGHQVLGAPAVPGAQQPQRSEGMGSTTSPVPERPGARPDASTTGR